MIWKSHIPPDIADIYEVHDYHHAAAILSQEFAPEFHELCEALRQFRLEINDLLTPGGNESSIPKKVAKILRPLGWTEERLKAELVINGQPVSHDTHFIDFVKNRVAFDLEWNSKDQTFDRDLYAFSQFFRFNRISVAVLLTRSKELDAVFKRLGTMSRYGASTTWMGKLLPRLDSGRNGGCPVLALGITSKVITDLQEIQG